MSFFYVMSHTIHLILSHHIDMCHPILSQAGWIWYNKIFCISLNEKCPRQSQAFVHLASNCWHCLGRFGLHHLPGIVCHWRLKGLLPSSVGSFSFLFVVQDVSSQLAVPAAIAAAILLIYHHRLWFPWTMNQKYTLSSLGWRGHFFFITAREMY